MVGCTLKNHDCSVFGVYNINSLVFPCTYFCYIIIYMHVLALVPGLLNFCFLCIVKTCTERGRPGTEVIHVHVCTVSTLNRSCSLTHLYQFQEALWCGVVVPPLIGQVHFTRFIDAAVHVGHEATDGVAHFR